MNIPISKKTVREVLRIQRAVNKLLENDRK